MPGRTLNYLLKIGSNECEDEMSEKPIVVNLTERGTTRVTAGKAGMTFLVDHVTQSGSHPGQWVAHVRDYRYKSGAAPYQIWSLSPDDYIAVEVSQAVER